MLTKTYTKRAMMTVRSNSRMQLGFGKLEKNNIFRLLENFEKVIKAGISHAQSPSASDVHSKVGGSSWRHYSL